MSKKRKVYSADLKSKLVLEILEGEFTLNEIASKYEIFYSFHSSSCGMHTT